MAKDNKKNFRSVLRTQVPQGRNGKHKHMVGKIMADLDHLNDGSALKIPLVELDDSKENIRAALSRATRKAGRNVATASDDGYLYVWNTT